ncbi:extracellular solute-binding protein [Halalkalibacter sp. AB-rgal2]|uniref:extracellular solute-binding protein n=1 Tax=Halalkalibacter sp. AB-rgal2 TaxID=3242695 RepID=UPI00359DD383
MKKFSLIVFICSLMVILFTGCSNNETSQEEAEDGVVHLTGIILKHPLTKDVNDIEWLKEAEDRAGVSIEWEEVTADWDQKKGAMLAGSDIPDLIVGPNAITDADFARFTGLFQDLTELIDDHAPNVQKMFDEKPETKIIATQLDENIYGLPKYQRFWPDTGTRQFINQEWLDNLGLDMPTNWDELHEVLLAFKEQDANGSGNPNDEIPMDFAPVGTGGFGFFHPTVLLGSTGMTISGGGGQGYFVEDSEVKNFFVDERYKEHVQFLNRLWADGLINSEVFTQEYTTYQSLGRGDGSTAKVGFTFGWEKTDRFGNELASQYTSMPQIAASANQTEDLSWTYDYNELNYGVNMVQMSSATENKEAAMRFINELYDPAVSMQVLFGSLGTNIEDNGDGSYTVLPPEDEQMDPGTWKWTTTWADNGPMYISDSLDLILGEDMQDVLGQTEPLNDVLSNIDTLTDVYPGIFIKYSDEDNNQMSLINTDFMNLAMAKYSQWITEGGIENEWDAYVAEIERIGLQTNLDIMQRYYDDYIQSIE